MRAPMPCLTAMDALMDVDTSGSLHVFMRSGSGSRECKTPTRTPQTPTTTTPHQPRGSADADHRHTNTNTRSVCSEEKLVRRVAFSTTEGTHWKAAVNVNDSHMRPSTRAKQALRASSHQRHMASLQHHHRLVGIVAALSASSQHRWSRCSIVDTLPAHLHHCCLAVRTGTGSASTVGIVAALP
jgi:hypothetical protein